MYKLGIDVGGTNTDAVIIDEKNRVIADIKNPTSEDIYSGIVGALRNVLDVSGVDKSKIGQAMLGTTQCTNAIVERKNLSPIGIMRIGAPATLGVKPMVDWEESIKSVAVGNVVIGGGSIILPDALTGASRTLKPEHFGCANAIGSAISKVSGTFEKLINYDDIPREEALAKAKEEAADMAVEAGAMRETVEIIDIEDVPLAYYPGNTSRVKIKAAGDLRTR